MLLGLIAILIFMLHESHLSDKIAGLMARAFPIRGPHGDKIICTEEDLNLLFEKVHLGISANMGIYFIACLYLVFLHWIIYKHWIRIDYEAFDYRAYQRLKQSHESLPAVIRFLHLPNHLKLWRLHGIDRIHALRGACIDHYHLPSDFQFSKYLKFAMRDVVIHILEVHPICWAVLVIALLFTFGRNALGVRVNDSLVTLMIYGALSLVVALCSLLVYIYMAVVFRKVLKMSSVRAHLHSSDAAYDRSFEPSETAISMSTHGRSSHSSGHHTDDEVTLDASSPLLSSKHRNWSSSSFSHEASMGSDTSMAADSDESQFDTTPWRGRPLPFQIFGEEGHGHGDGLLSLMSVDRYREYSNRVRHILKRVAASTDEDEAHKSALFFRSRRLIIIFLQVITFVQTWLLGLSIYYVYSIYVDIPKAPLPYPILNAFPFIGPLITYGLMGPTLSKIVKATYTGGLVRADLLLEALFLPQSHEHPDAKNRRKHKKHHGKHSAKNEEHSHGHDTHDSGHYDHDHDHLGHYPSSGFSKSFNATEAVSPSSRLPLPKTNCPDSLDSDYTQTDLEGSDLDTASDFENNQDTEHATQLQRTMTPSKGSDADLVLN